MRPPLLVLGLALLLPVCHASEEAPRTAPLYLPRVQGGGSAWCFDPDSPALAARLTAPVGGADSPVDASALGDDIPDLRELLRTSYPGYAVLAQAADFDVDAFFRGWERSLRGHATVSFSDGVVEPFRTLRGVAVDQHLSPWFSSEALRRGSALEVGEYQAVLAADDQLDLGRCVVEGARHVHGSTLRRSWSLDTEGLRPLVTVSASVADRPALRCGERTLTLRERAADPVAEVDEHAPPYSWKLEGDTAVIRLRRLWGSTADLAVLAQIPKDFALHAQARRIVFDLRGNGGGDDGYVYAWIAEAKDGLWFSGAETKREGALFPCADWNELVARQIREDTVATEAARRERETLRARWPAEAPDNRDVFDDGLVRDHAPHPYRGQIYALVDRRSASSGETSAWVLRQALGAVVLGERSAGYLSYGNLRTVVLARSGLRVRVPTKRSYYDVPMEAVGVAVDVYLARVGAPIEEILPLLDLLERSRGARVGK